MIPLEQILANRLSVSITLLVGASGVCNTYSTCTETTAQNQISQPLPKNTYQNINDVAAVALVPRSYKIRALRLLLSCRLILERRTTRCQRPLRLLIHPPQQPIRQPHHPRPNALLPIPALLHMLNNMLNNPPLFIKLKDKQPRKLILLPRRHTPLVSTHPLPNRPPPHHQLLSRRYAARVEGRGAGGLHHSLGEDLEAHVADYGDPAPGDGGGPDGGDVGDAAVNGGEVGVGRGEEVECYLWGENGGGEGREEEGGEERLECA